MDYTLRFDELSRSSVAIAGGKGAQLGEMTRASIPVPPGFVVTTHAFDEFITHHNLQEKINEELGKVAQSDTASVNAASEKIRAIIEKAYIPKEIEANAIRQFDLLGAKYVAVRSSATAEDASAASWAGELDTYLNTTRETLLDAIRMCWSSLFTPRAIFYRFEKGLQNTHVSVGVVVQKMVQSEVSGVTFTANPVTKNLGEMVIEAGYGLGEAIVSGMITPDNYIVDKGDAVLMDVNIGEQEQMIVKSETDGKAANETLEVPAERRSMQKLAGKQILELARICHGIEKHYGSPQDIEWALEGGKFYIVQARPITTL